MRSLRFAMATIVGCLLLSVGCAALGSELAHADFGGSVPGARTVALADASVPPREQAYLWPEGSVTYALGREGENCHTGNRFEWFSDVQAYRWNGHPFASAQHWNAAKTRYEWRDSHGRAVTFDGITFRNHTHRKVIVAGWCE